MVRLRIMIENKQKFRKIQKQLSVLINQLEKEAIDNGEDISSDDFLEAILEIKKRFLENKGISLEEYDELRSQFAEEKRINQSNVLIHKEEVEGDLKGLKKLIDEKIVEIKKDNEKGFEDISDSLYKLNDRLAEVENRPPSIVNKIVKEITKEVPKIIQTKETIREVDNETKLNVDTLQRSFVDIWDKVNNFKMPEVPNYDKLKGELISWSADHISKNPNLINMPDFRRMGMGLQGQIDELRNSITTQGSNLPENLSSQCDGSNTDFTTTRNINAVQWLSLNGTLLMEGVNFTIIGNNKITLTSPVPSLGEELFIKYT